MSTTNRAPKRLKIDVAVDAYNKYIDQKDKLPKREFRALVVKQIAKDLGTDVKGTLGMYFAWADRKINNRPAKHYNRTGGRAAKGSAGVNQAAEKKITAALKEFQSTQNANTVTSQSRKVEHVDPSDRTAFPGMRGSLV